MPIIGNLSTRRSWYHGRQPEVFSLHDSHCACQDVLELQSRTSKREFSGNFVPRVKNFFYGTSPGDEVGSQVEKSIRHTKVEILRPKSCFLCKKEKNLTQIFERHFQLNYSVGVRDGFTFFRSMICISRANSVPDPVLRGQNWIWTVRESRMSGTQVP